MTMYGYCRVSTKEQSLSDQIQQLKSNSVSGHNVYSEKYTGTKTDRPIFDKLLNVLKPDDTLVIVKLDRLARNTREALNVIHDLWKNDITIKVLQPKMTVSNDIGGKIMYQTLLMVADFERDMIIERTQRGKAYAKANNPDFKEGRPRSTKRSRVKGVSYGIIYDYTKEHSVRTTASEFDIAPSTVSKIKKICSR